MTSFQLEPIGIFYSDFKEKFGTPRQSLMVPSAKGVLKLNPHPQFEVGLRHLETFSHLWIIYIFHQHLHQKWHPAIQPPRLDAPERVGVFASRSPHRPNPIGLSTVRLEKIDLTAREGIEIHVSGGDILDQTPVLDIKPYLPLSDKIEGANSGWAGSKIQRFRVQFESGVDEPSPLIREVLEWDPRPTSQRQLLSPSEAHAKGARYGIRILNFEVTWCFDSEGITVLSVTPLN